MHQKLAPDPFLILLNNPKQQLHGRNSFLNKIYILKEDYQTALKELTLFFLSNLAPFNRQSYQKQKGSGISDQSLFRLQNKFKNISLFVIYYLTKFDVYRFLMTKQFLIYSKIYISKFMQVHPWHHKLFHLHLSFWIWKVWKGREKIIKIWISRERKELFRWNKKHFS